MTTVLVATLGESPIVVSGMVNVLRAEGIVLDLVQVIYPDVLNERWISVGYDLLAKHLRKQGLQVEPKPLDFADAYTEEHSLSFLRLLNDILAEHERASNPVHLSLAGGRKHISALMSVLTQFYRCVQGLYHLHDTQERDPRQQFTIQDLERYPDLLDQPAHRFTLVRLPYQPLVDSVALLRWFAQHDRDVTPAPIPVSPAAESFYAALFRQRPPGSQQRLQLRLSKTAFDRYKALLESSGTQQLEEINSYLETMVDAEWLRANAHDGAQDRQPANIQEGSGGSLMHYVCRRRRHPGKERPFFYTQPNPITEYPRKQVTRLVITRFSFHINKTDYDLALDKWVENPDVEPLYELSDFPARPTVLIAPLGESPMVVTQTYTLLQAQQPPTKVIELRVLYPEQHDPARNSAMLLQQVCQKRGITLHLYPLPFADLDSSVAVDAFTVGLKQAVAEARTRNPSAAITMLLSGGRKGMSALTLNVAQVEGINRVYHSTICDPERERDVERRTCFNEIMAKSRSEQASLLFLDQSQFDQADFTLIQVPVISLRISETQ